MCRGCRLHFMLRSACLLPAARLAPPHGLLTPRSGTEVSLHCLGSATRRTDAYRDGTLTRGGGAASQGRTTPFGIQFFLSVTTHHGCIVIGRCATPSPRVGGSLGRPVAAADRPSSEMRCRGALDSNQRPKNHRVAADARSLLYFSSSGSLALLQRARFPLRSSRRLAGFRRPARAAGSPTAAWGLLPGAPTLTGTGLPPAGVAQQASGTPTPAGVGVPSASRRTMRR